MRWWIFKFPHKDRLREINYLTGREHDLCDVSGRTRGANIRCVRHKIQTASSFHQVSLFCRSPCQKVTHALLCVMMVKIYFVAFMLIISFVECGYWSTRMEVLYLGNGICSSSQLLSYTIWLNLCIRIEFCILWSTRRNLGMANTYKNSFVYVK